MVAKAVLIGARPNIGDILPHQNSRLCQGGLCQVGLTCAPLSASHRTWLADQAQIHRLPGYVVAVTWFGDASEFQQFECGTSDGLGQSTDYLQVGITDAAFDLSEEASATPARAARSCWLRPAQRRAALRLCPKRDPIFPEVRSKATISPAFVSAKPGGWSVSRQMRPTTELRGGIAGGADLYYLSSPVDCTSAKKTINREHRARKHGNSRCLPTSFAVSVRFRAASRSHFGARP